MAKPRRATGGFAAAEATLRDHAMAKPEATEHFPWGERAIKVKGKVFLFMYADASKLSLSTKLPESNGVALLLPFAQPTGYGLGKAGWVSASFEPGDQPPLDVLCAWIDESYQAVAPARLAALVRTERSPTRHAEGGPQRTSAVRDGPTTMSRGRPDKGQPLARGSAAPDAAPAAPRRKPAGKRTAAKKRG